MIDDCHGWLCGKKLCQSCYPTVPKQKFREADNLLRDIYPELKNFRKVLINHMEQKAWMQFAKWDLDKLIKNLDDYFNE